MVTDAMVTDAMVTIIEDPKIYELVRQVTDVIGGVVSTKPKKNQQTRANLTYDATIHRDAGFPDPLNDQSHRGLLVSK